MSKDYLHKFRRKIDAGGCYQGDMETTELRETFEKMIDEKLSPTVHTVKYIRREDVGVDTVGVDINVNIIDVSGNDQKTNDEKFINLKLGLNAKSGDQIYWHNTWWVLYHEEKRTIMSNATFTCKKCNFDYNVEVNGIKYYFPTLLMNLTLYSDGMADQTYMSNQDGSRRITVPDNKYTEFIRLGTRIMISRDTVYEVCHIDDFTRRGIKDCMLKQVFMSSKDDKENLIAWNDFDKIQQKGDMEEVQGEGILGEDVIRLGANEIYFYTFANKDCVPSWTIEAEDNCVEIDTSYYNGDDCSKIRLKCTKDAKYIGTIVKITATIDPGTTHTKEIRVGGMF